MKKGFLDLSQATFYEEHFQRCLQFVKNTIVISDFKRLRRENIDKRPFLYDEKSGLSLFSNTKIYMNMLKIYREYANFGLVPQADDFLQKRDIFLRL